VIQRHFNTTFGLFAVFGCVIETI